MKKLWNLIIFGSIWAGGITGSAQAYEFAKCAWSFESTAPGYRAPDSFTNILDFGTTRTARRMYFFDVANGTYVRELTVTIKAVRHDFGVELEGEITSAVVGTLRERGSFEGNAGGAEFSVDHIRGWATCQPVQLKYAFLQPSGSGLSPQFADSDVPIVFDADFSRDERYRGMSVSEYIAANTCLLGSAQDAISALKAAPDNIWQFRSSRKLVHPEKLAALPDGSIRWTADIHDYVSCNKTEKHYDPNEGTGGDVCVEPVYHDVPDGQVFMVRACH